MITKYDEFLVEQVISMINESEVVFSNKFKSLLRDIDSPISKSLAEIETKDIKVASNYFDISDKETISFIADRKAQEMIGENKEKFAIVGHSRILSHNLEQNGGIFNRLGYVPQGDKGFVPEEGDRGKVISKTVSPSSQKVFVFMKFDGTNGESGQCVINEENITYDDASKEAWIKNRQTIRTGRGVRALLNSANVKFTDAEIEDFVNKYKAAFDRLNDIFRKFDLVSGPYIAHFYNHRNYRLGQSRGTLGNSCMSGVSPNFFKIYVENPEVCSLLILKSDDDDAQIKGRALIWKLTLPEGITFMDRVYTHDDSDVQLFKDYAKFKGWYYKMRNDSSSDPVTISPSGDQTRHDELATIIKKKDYLEYPYVDTLKYLCERDKDIKISTDDSDSKCMEDTGGGIIGEDDCDRCGGSGRVECDRCDGERYYDCDRCDGSGKQECRRCDGGGKEDCSSCNGTGKDKNEEKCRDCGGSGKQNCSNCDGTGEEECHECDGSGRVECDECDGSGRVDCPDCQ